MKNTSFLILFFSLFLLSFKDGEKKFPVVNVKSLDGKSVDREELQKAVQKVAQRQHSQLPQQLEILLQKISLLS